MSLEFVKTNEFDSYIRPEVQQINAPELNKRVLSVAKHFCEKTKILKMELDAMDLVRDQASYEVVMPDVKIRPVAVMSMRDQDGSLMREVEFREMERSYAEWRDQSGTPRAWIPVERGEFMVYPKPDNDSYSVQNLLVAYRPATPTVENPISEIPLVLFEEYYNAIVHGVLGEMLDQRNEPWYSPDRARRHYLMYCDDISRYRLKGRRRFSNAPARVDFRGNTLIVRGTRSRVW